MSDISDLTTNYTGPTQRGGKALVRAATVLTAAGSALIGWAIAGPLLGIDLTVRLGSTTQQVGALSVVAVSVLAGLAGWALLAVLQRVTAHARTVWTIAALTLLVVSLAGPLGSTHPSSTIALVCLHLIVGVVLILGLRRSPGEFHAVAPLHPSIG